MHQTTSTALAICLLLLGACGQMGPLYSPEEPRPDATQTETPQTNN